jgi:Glyoxalase-like domain
VKIDHVSIAGSDLGKMQTNFENFGMKTEYGGPHSDATTHMSLLGFDDGSYIELISTYKPGSEPLWGKHIHRDGGPCAWAVSVDDMRSEVNRIKKLGIKVIGPDSYSRRRPDGVLIEWELAFVGDKPPGATLPFLIKDKTPRDYRVKPSPSVSQKNMPRGTSPGRLIGLAKVVLGVSDLESGIRLFQTVYGWKEPEESDECLQGAIVADFEGTPVALASSRGDSWLKERLTKFGDSPCAFLIGTTNIQATERTYGLNKKRRWFEQSVAWIPKEKLGGSLLGFLQRSQ